MPGHSQPPGFGEMALPLADEQHSVNIRAGLLAAHTICAPEVPGA